MDPRKSAFPVARRIALVVHEEVETVLPARVAVQGAFDRRLTAAQMTASSSGKFCRSLASVSASPGSLGVTVFGATPSSSKSMPRPTVRVNRVALNVVAGRLLSTLTPCVPLKAITWRRARAADLATVCLVDEYPLFHVSERGGAGDISPNKVSLHRI